MSMKSFFGSNVKRKSNIIAVGAVKAAPRVSKPRLPKNNSVRSQYKSNIAPQSVEFELEKQSDLYLQKLSEEELIERRLKLDTLLEDLSNDNQIPLVETLHEENRMVTHRGPLNAKLMIIGEGPGKDEARHGLPFVGASGNLLANQLKLFDISLDKDVFITNTVFIRTSANNRDPTFEEVRAFAPYVRRLIDIVRPTVILTLGRLSSSLIRTGFGNLKPLKGAYNEHTDMHYMKGINMEKLYLDNTNGSALTFRNESFVTRTYASYHPSAILRAVKGTAACAKKEERWYDDFKKVKDLLTDRPLEFVDISQIVKDTSPQDFQFCNPDTQTFYVNPNRLTRNQALDYASNGLEFEMHRLEYNDARNFYTMFGRTIDGHSVAVRINSPRFSVKFSHPCFKMGFLEDDSIEYDQFKLDLQDIIRKAYITMHGGFKNSRRELFMEEAKLDFSVEKRIKVIDIGYAKPFLNITYRNPNLYYALKKGVEELSLTFPITRPPKTYEGNLTPLEQLLLEKNVYTRGWVVFEAESSLTFTSVASERITSAELEYTVDYNDVKGFSPNIGESGDAKWERYAPTDYMSIDAEMMGKQGLFPIAEQDPIINICAVSNRFDRSKGQNILERLRNPDSGKSRETRLTGRSNYSDVAAFIVGSLTDCSTKEFKRVFLPNIPFCPKAFPTVLKDGIIIKSPATETTPETFTYADKYAESIREWNAFLSEYRTWHTLVGRRRAQAVIQNKHLYQALNSLEERPGGKDPTKEWTSRAKVLKWEEDVLSILQRWKCINPLDIDLIKEPKSWMEKHKYNPETVTDNELASLCEEFGEIQAYWTLCHPKPKVFSFETEEDMLRGFYKYVQEFDPDVLTGYNVSNFDFSYFTKRVKVLELREKEKETNLDYDDYTPFHHGFKAGNLISMGRTLAQEDEDKVKNSFSRATGDRSYHTLKIGGRDVYDFMNYMMREAKLQSYGLGYVSKSILKDTKNDVPHTSIPSLFHNDRKTLTDYCVKDAELVMMLLIIGNNPTFLTTLARLISLLNTERLYVDGKQVQVFSVLMRFMRTDAAIMLMNDINKYSGTLEEFLGAFVGDPKTKGLYEKLLLCKDFNSLYPSLMLAFHLAHNLMGTAGRMQKLNIPLSSCYKTRRQFVNPKTGQLEYYYFKQPDLYTEKQAKEANLDLKQCSSVPAKTFYFDFNREKFAHIPRKIRVKLDPQYEPTKVDRIAEAFTELESQYERDPDLRPGPRDPESLGIYEPDPETGAVYVEPKNKPIPKDHEILQYTFAKDDAEFTRYSVPVDMLEKMDLTPDSAVGCVLKKPEMFFPKDQDGLICGSTRKVLDARNRIKKMMPGFKPSSPEYKRLDSNQLSLKMIANSGYGATGVKNGKLAAIAIADSVTREGRRTIKNLRDECHLRYCADTQGGDTDSVFTHFPHITELDQIYEKIPLTDPQTGITTVKTRISEVLDFSNSLVPHPMKIDFEKAFRKMFAIKKKRAACVTCMPEWDSVKMANVFKNQGKLDFKGLETKRRDSCLIAQKTFTGFLERVMALQGSLEERMEKATSFVREKVQMIVDGKIERHEAIQSRQISKKTYGTKLPHIEVCKKLAERGQQIPGLGERVPFIIINGAADLGFAESAEDPIFMMENNIEPSWKHILETKVMKPIQRFTSCMEPMTKAYDQKMFGGIRKVQRRVIDPNNPLAKLMVKKNNCIQCGVATSNMVCSSCQFSIDWERQNQLFNKEFNEAESVYQKKVEHCRGCTGTAPGKPIDCGNVECEHFFPRRFNEQLVTRDLPAKMKRFREEAEQYGILFE